MAYNANIPQATDQISISQGQILGNFSAINTWVGVNHVGFNVADAGKHNFVELTPQGSAPTILATEIGLYNFSDSTTSTNELWITPTNASAVRVAYPVTASNLSTSTPVDFTNGFMYSPGGQLIKWGRATGLSSGANVITLTTGATAGPLFSNSLYVVNLTAISGGANPTVQFLSWSGAAAMPQTITISVSNTTACFYYLVGV